MLWQIYRVMRFVMANLSMSCYLKIKLLNVVGRVWVRGKKHVTRFRGGMGISSIPRWFGDGAISFFKKKNPTGQRVGAWGGDE